jgi:hypothetical protein
LKKLKKKSKQKCPIAQKVFVWQRQGLPKFMGN